MASSTKITPSSPRFASLLSDVERGNIKIPIFQRQYIWSDEQIVSLLDSIYRGYPVGSLDFPNFQIINLSSKLREVHLLSVM